MKKTERRKLPVQEESAEIELSADELLDLSRAHPVAQSPSVPRVERPNECLVSTPPAAKRVTKIWHSPLVLASVGSVLLLATIATLRFETAAASLQTELPSAAAEVDAEDALEAPSEVQDTTPVRIRNPFDKSEVFEFPSGTSEQQAHDAVADMLLKRAMDRQAEYDARRAKRRRAT
jgi:hypothetical protein